LRRSWLKKNFSRDEHDQTGILASASILTPAFPSFRLVALGVCSRYSGATVPDSHRVPRHLTVIFGGKISRRFKEHILFTRNKKNFQVKFSARGKLALKRQHLHNVVPIFIL
jgi:hypothetical protein